MATTFMTSQKYTSMSKGMKKGSKNRVKRISTRGNSMPAMSQKKAVVAILASTLRGPYLSKKMSR